MYGFFPPFLFLQIFFFFSPFKGKKKFSGPCLSLCSHLLPIAIPSTMLDAPHMLSFQPFLKLSSWGEGREAS